MARNTKQPAEMIDAREFADRIGLCRTTVLRLRRRGQIKAVAFNKRNLRFPVSEIARLQERMTYV